jgi:hypothetical protein
MALALAMVGLAACGNSERQDSNPTADAADQAASEGGGDAGDSNATQELITLPMVVDFYFFPSGAFGRLIDVGADGSEDSIAEGCEGDDVGEWQNVTTDQTDDACPTRPSEVTDDLALGLSRCTAFSFSPTGLDAVDETTWAGVLWQNSTCNWGASPPSQVEAGATTLSFWAWSDAANVGATVLFQSGGIGRASTPYRDTFNRTLAVTLSDTPTRYELDLSGASYPGGVISAFGWTAERGDLRELHFYVDGMVWQ